MKPTLSIIILTWNQKDVLAKCINSLEATLQAMPCEVIIIDNGSTDGTAEWLKAQYPEFTLIKNTQNRGVAAARNQGIIASNGEYILILDNDTVANHKAISAMLSHLQSHADTGIVACRLLNEDGSIQDSCKEYPGLILKIKNVLNIKNTATFTTDSEGVIHPTYVIGACQMFSRSLYNTIGLIDENIFYGPEDADFCIRAAKAGFHTSCITSQSIFHIHRRATTHAIFSPLGIKHIKALLYFYTKHKRWL